MTSPRDERRALWLLAGAVGLVAAPLLVGQVLYYGDIALQFVPWRLHARQQILAGLVPLWLPETYGGQPFLANGQSAVLYPVWWLLLPLGPARQISVACVLHLLLGAVGGYRFGRGLGRPPEAAAILGLAFGLSGYVVVRQQFPSLVCTLAWLPWQLEFARRVFGRPSTGGVAALGAICGLAQLAGHAQMMLLQSGLVWLWLVAAAPCEGRRSSGLAAVGAAFALGGLIGSAQLLPQLEMLRSSTRSGFDFNDSARFSLPVWHLPLWIWPHILGRPQAPPYWLGVGPYWEHLAYAGVVALPLAVAGARGRRFWAILAVASLIVACGRYLPVYRWLWELLPPLRMFRDPTRFQLAGVLAVAVLAAHGTEPDCRPTARRAALVLLGLTTALLAATLIVPRGGFEALLEAVLARSPTKSVDNPALLARLWQVDLARGLLVTAALLAIELRLLRRDGATGWGLPLLLAADLVIHGFGLNPTTSAGVFAADPRPTWLRTPDVLIHVPVGDSAALAETAFSMARYLPGDRVPAALSNLVCNAGVGWRVRQLAGYDPLVPARVLAWQKTIEDWDEAAVRARLAGLGCAGIWSKGIWTPLPAAPRVRGGGERLKMVQVTPQRWRAEGLSNGARLTMTQSPSPGWRAERGRLTAGGEAVETAWVVPAGAERSGCWYAPVSIRLGWFVSLAGLATLSGAAAASHRFFRCRRQSGGRLWYKHRNMGEHGHRGPQATAGRLAGRDSAE